MIWRAGPLLIVQRGEALVIVDQTGEITKRFEPQRWAYEDDMGETSYAVVEGQLRQRAWVQGWGGRTSSEEALVIDGLVEATDAESARFVEVALGDAAVVEEERRLEAERRARARVAAIEGGTAELGYGAEVAAAQRVLIARIQAFADERAGRLLHGLVALARARVDERVIVRYAHGCRYACFERPPELATEVLPEHAGPPALVELLRAIAAELDADSDYKDWIDARGEAVTLAIAARHVQRAAELLAGPDVMR